MQIACHVLIYICAYMSTYICVCVHTCANTYKYLFRKKAGYDFLFAEQ